MAAFDVLGLGCVAVDDLLHVAAYPPADTKTPVRRRERQCGGLAATALVAAARLGVRCAYAGPLGSDDDSRFMAEYLRSEGVDLTYLRQRPGARPIRACVIVDESRRTRTIFYDLPDTAGAELDWPPEGAIRSARVLLVDQFGIEGMCRAARVARAAGVAVVADLECDEWPGFAELLALADHLLVNRAFAGRLTGEQEPATAVDRLWTEGRQAVVVTDGAAGCWFRAAEKNGAVRHQPAFPVQAMDTTGCGDVFRGAYAAGLLWGWDAAARVRFASAAAALKAARGEVPDRAAVNAARDFA